jgi:diguanylate cyclase
MYFPDDQEKAAKLALSALERMRDLAVPATPSNYTVWYVYCRGSAPDLKRDLDVLISNRHSFTNDRNTEIYERYFGFAAERRALRDTGERLEQAINKLMTAIGEAGNDSAHYSEALADFSGRLDATGDKAEIRQIIADVLLETKRMAEQHHKLQDELNGSALEMQELRESIKDARREALTDALTGIANRKAFDERLREEIEDANSDTTPLSLLLIDIDHFKQFNDSYGHQFGDQVLKLVARTFTECIKGRDFAARYGGEEFVILLPKTELGNAVTLANQIRETVAKKKIVNRQSGQNLGHITISIGASQLQPGESDEGIISRADQALYVAKNSGRNRVEAGEAQSSTAAA